ncbi:MAG: rhodanese-like domain-containing protein [Bacteroidia bacterium]|nr:rhodanese-like domain-containing protein [Bacteroidia bacterium]
MITFVHQHFFKQVDILAQLLRGTNPDLDGASFKQKFMENPSAILLDVRTPSEHHSEAIPGSINIDFMSANFETELANLDKSKTYFVYCRSGNRSSRACKTMKGLGLTCYNLEYGIDSWPLD